MLKELWYLLIEEDTSEGALKLTCFNLLALWMEKPFEKLEYCEEVKVKAKQMILDMQG